MNLNQLQTQHPDTFAAAVADGVAKERDRVCGHLELGKTSGALETAYAAIKDGSPMTQTLTAKYLAAGMNKATHDPRASHEETLAAIERQLGKAKQPDDPQADAIVDTLAKNLGKTSV